MVFYLVFPNSPPPPRIVRRRVFFFNLKSCSSSFVLNSIPSPTTFSFSSSRSSHSSFIFSSHLESKSSHLKTKSHNSSKLLKFINISFLNIKSFNNKFIHIFNFFSDSNLDFLTFSETWHELVSSPSLTSSCPPSYSSLELARASEKLTEESVFLQS